ncbi:MAG: homocysteine S-methyltransferase family protein [Pseudomonadota bacterium]
MADIVLMDGGMGQELIRRAPGPTDRGWGARVMLDHPEMVVDLHKAFIEAGATMIIVNAYAATRCRLADIGREELFEPLQTMACDLAKRARDETGVDVALAGSISPIQFSYRPDVVRPADEIAERCAEIAELQAPHVDVMICETMSMAAEAAASADGATSAGCPVWVGVTVDDGDGSKGRGGEPLSDFVAATDKVDAWFANCSKPEAVATAMTALSDLDVAFGGYANGFETLPPPSGIEATADRLIARKDLTPSDYAGHAMTWVDAGAGVVGGCCDVGPGHIAALKDALQAAGHNIVKPAL